MNKHTCHPFRLFLLVSGSLLLPASALLAAAPLPAAVVPRALVEQEVSSDRSPAGNDFGYSLALSGDTALIGAWSEDDQKGAAYFYTRSGGTWIESQRIAPAEQRLNDEFGIPVALDGDTAAVTARGYDLSHHSAAGAVFVYNLTGGSWVQSQLLIAPGPPSGTYFGIALALKGDYLVVGTPDATVNGNRSQGAVFVFVRSHGLWTLRQELTDPEGTVNSRFASVVAVSSEGTVFAESEASVNGLSGAGAVLVYSRNGRTWTQTQKLTANVPEENAYFGTAIACSDSTAVIGAYSATVDGLSGAGKVYVFTDNSGTYTQTQELVSPDPQAYSSFGGAIAIARSRLAIGAPAMQIGDHAFQGATYLFDGAPGSYVFRQQLTASNGAANSEFGISVGLSPDTVLVGAPRQPVRTEFQDGAAYFYSQPPQ